MKATGESYLKMPKNVEQQTTKFAAERNGTNWPILNYRKTQIWTRKQNSLTGSVIVLSLGLKSENLTNSRHVQILAQQCDKIWENFATLGKNFQVFGNFWGFFYILQILYYGQNFNCFKWPNIELIISPSVHTVAQTKLLGSFDNI